MLDEPGTRATLQVDPGDAGALRLSIGGRLDARCLHPIWGRARRAIQSHAVPEVVVDAAAVTFCDASGATMIDELRQLQEDRGGTFVLRSFPEHYSAVLELLRRSDNKAPECPPSAGWLEGVGTTSVAILRDTARLIGDIGEIFAALVHALLHPRQIRWDDMLRTAQTAGVNSTPVVVLVSGLLGLIMGFQSATTLHAYGGDLLLADLLGIAFLRELGPLMTAIILTARSGSAFAAELGTMQISEEVAALRTMGVDPVRFLVAPRVLAAILMTPLLTVFANIAGLTGGFLVWAFTLDLSLPAYFNQLESALEPFDLITGLIKSVVFGTLVAGIGCIRGMQTEGSASAVGSSTTRAVVSGIVLIAIADSIFTVVFHYLDL